MAEVRGGLMVIHSKKADDSFDVKEESSAFLLLNDIQYSAINNAYCILLSSKPET